MFHILLFVILYVLGGKTFNSGLSQITGPPRKALGDVNKNTTPLAQKPDIKKQQTQPGFQKPKGLQIRETNIIGNQPLSSKPGNVQKVFSYRIYNYTHV